MSTHRRHSIDYRVSHANVVMLDKSSVFRLRKTWRGLPPSLSVTYIAMFQISHYSRFHIIPGFALFQISQCSRFQISFQISYYSRFRDFTSYSRFLVVGLLCIKLPCQQSLFRVLFMNQPRLLLLESCGSPPLPAKL